MRHWNCLWIGIAMGAAAGCQPTPPAQPQTPPGAPTPVPTATVYPGVVQSEDAVKPMPAPSQVTAPVPVAAPPSPTVGGNGDMPILAPSFATPSTSH